MKYLLALYILLVNCSTITYNVGSFAQKQDKTIGDVLKRMPGIDVANNGKIQYQGTDINKFYIEGMTFSEANTGSPQTAYPMRISVPSR